MQPGDIDRRSLHLVDVDSGATFFRVTRPEYASTFTPAGTGHARFSPLPDRSHTYVAEQRSAALLESALHEASGPNARIYRAQLSALVLTEVRFTGALRLVDLRDDALAALGLDRRELTDAGPRHYTCTQAVAARLAGTKGADGLLWTSRQGALHAERNRDGLASEVLRHESLDVAVVYTPDDVGTLEHLASEPLLVNDRPTRFVLELANLLRIAIL